MGEIEKFIKNHQKQQNSWETDKVQQKQIIFAKVQPKPSTYIFNLAVKQKAKKL